MELEGFCEELVPAY